MKIHLMKTPWADAPAHEIIAETKRDWLSAICQIPPDRYSAAVFVEDLDQDKPFPVQQLHGAQWPAEVVSADGFLVIRTGLKYSGLAGSQWTCLSEFPEHLRLSDKFLHSTTQSVIRRSVYPKLHSATDNSDDTI